MIALAPVPVPIEPGELLSDGGQFCVRLVQRGQGVVDVLGAVGFLGAGSLQLGGQLLDACFRLRQLGLGLIDSGLHLDDALTAA